MTDTTARPKIYTDEFRRAAVDLIIAGKLTVAEAARLAPAEALATGA